MNQELPDVQDRFRKGRVTIDQIANIQWIIQEKRIFQENIYFCFIDYTNSVDCVDHNKLWKNFKEIGIPDHFMCLLRNMYVGLEAMARTEHAGVTGSKMGNEYDKAVYCHPVYLTYIKYKLLINRI